MGIVNGTKAALVWAGTPTFSSKCKELSQLTIFQGKNRDIRTMVDTARILYLLALLLRLVGDWDIDSPD